MTCFSCFSCNSHELSFVVFAWRSEDTTDQKFQVIIVIVEKINDRKYPQGAIFFVVSAFLKNAISSIFISHLFFERP